MHLHSFPTSMTVAFLCLLCLSLGKPSLAQGQAAPPGKNVVKINPLSLVVSTFSIQAERRLGTRFSGLVGGQLGWPKLSIFAPNLIAPIAYRIAGITPELRYYFSFLKRPVPKGPYLGVFLRYQRIRKEYSVTAYDPDRFQDVTVEVLAGIHAVSGGFLLGYQFVVGQHLSLDLFIGPKYGQAYAHYQILCPGCNGNERMAAKPGLQFDGIDIRAGLGVGYAF